MSGTLAAAAAARVAFMIEKTSLFSGVCDNIFDQEGDWSVADGMTRAEFHEFYAKVFTTAGATTAKSAANEYGLAALGGIAGLMILKRTLRAVPVVGLLSAPILAGYDSDSTSDEASDEQELRTEDQHAPAASPGHHRDRGDLPGSEHHQGGEDSEDYESSEESVDSATMRAREADLRLRDHGEEVSSGAGRQAQLPSAFDMFDEVAGPPTFLDPESTRPLAASRTHGFDVVAPSAPVSTAWHGPRGNIAPGQEFDLARLAPLLKGESRPGTGPEKRSAPAGAVIEAKFKRNKTMDAPEYTAMQVALLGGNVADRIDAYKQAMIALMGGDVADQGGDEGGGTGSVQAVRGPTPAAGHGQGDASQGKRDRGPSTKPMPVSEFMDKGAGGAQLPRRAQDRKDKEKLKREAGQSVHASWKTEAEMVLRQQYD
ncbi:MAG: hypothetical protein WDW36_001569 [Sanguina aurantia]